jgi:hypothetical protein
MTLRLPQPPSQRHPSVPTSFARASHSRFAVAPPSSSEDGRNERSKPYTAMAGIERLWNIPGCSYGEIVESLLTRISGSAQRGTGLHRSSSLPLLEPTAAIAVAPLFRLDSNYALESMNELPSAFFSPNSYPVKLSLQYSRAASPFAILTRIDRRWISAVLFSRRSSAGVSVPIYV